ncbi:MAG TPA: tetratricopeptide repeat protein [Asticcacaulis sp.]|nr:tetratricopeptide repeat protein [Asticcacaulis sp.]
MTTSPPSPTPWMMLEEGLACHNAGRLDQARELYTRVLAAEPANAQALDLFGALECQAGRFDKGLELLDRSLALRPDQPDVVYNRGLALDYLGRSGDALASYDSVLKLRPDHAQAWFARANILQAQKRFDEAVVSYDRATQFMPNLAEAHSNRAYAMHCLNRLQEALAGYDRALALRPDLVETLVHRGTALHALGRFPEAVVSFERALQLNPRHVEAWFMRGNSLTALRRLDAALISFEQALAIKPDRADAWSNRGNLLQDLNRFDEALDSYGQAIKAQPAFIDARNNRANALQAMGRLEESADDFDAVVATDPDFQWAQGQALYTRMQLADWRDFDHRRDALAEAVAQGRAVTPAFQVQPMFDSPDLQRQASEIYRRQAFPENTALPKPPAPLARDRIRIGYFSSDFSNHPVAHLMAGVLERHDRKRFEIFAFSLSHFPVDEWRARIEAAADHFIDVTDMPDIDLLAKVRDLGIDIAIDLNGWTKGNRAGLFAARLAPIQVNYIGYLGSMAAPYMDYLIADETIVPPGHDAFYDEKIVYLPSFQVNDDRQAASNRTVTRAELGLPDDGFVFCSFNQLFKLRPDVFDGWMRILDQVPGSVLWLFVTNEAAKVNLRREAAARGIDPDRLVFAAKWPLADHLARLKQADLFLDSHPYNAGATASNALRMGLPVLTRIGEAFPARMGASLLQAVGLPELITQTPEAYEALAVRLATRPDELVAIRRKLADKLPTSLLFDTEHATRSLETAFTVMVERARAGQPPQSIRV